MLEFSQIHDLRTKQSRATYFLQCLHTSRIITCTAFFSASSSGYVLGIIMMMPHWKYKTGFIPKMFVEADQSCTCRYGLWNNFDKKYLRFQVEMFG